MIPINSLDSFKRFIFKKVDKADIDSLHFKLHYRVTFMLFTAATLLTTAKAYFSKSIACSHDSKVNNDIIDIYCWINSTFSVVDESGPVATYGVANSAMQTREIFIHSYYQWLPYFFFLQAVSFYLPHLIWKISEGGKLNGVTHDIRGFRFGIDDKIRDIGRYISYDRQYICSRRTLAVYLICESLNLLNMALQCRLLNLFLNVDLVKYDFAFGEFFDSTSDKSILLKQTFPTFGKCLYRDYGPSGDIQVLDSLCLLPINMFNEKIFLVLWLYLNILTICTVFGLCFVILRIVGFPFLPSLFYGYLRYFQSREPGEILLITDVAEMVPLSDFFLLYLLEKNLCRKNFMRLLKEFHTAIVERKKDPEYNKMDEANRPSGKDNAAYGV